MMVKPSGCCDRNGVSPYGTPRPVIPLDARLSTRLRCDKGQRCDKQRYVIEVGRTLSRAPSCVRLSCAVAYFGEPGRNRGALNMHVGLTMFPTDYSMPPQALAVEAE